MSDKKLFLGIDTSNYTTSIAVCDSDGRVVLNLKRLLDVKEGERGLRQSDALFLHTRNMPEMMQSLRCFLEADFCDAEIAAVGCSATPRDVEGSYMPCFLSGIAVAEAAGAAIQCPVYSFSHQNGHVMAALYSSGMTELLDCEKPFAAFHVSGGTTEILLVTPKEEGFTVEQIGGSADMNAGQAIDRTGVMMGLKFPCGREMESLCSIIPHRKVKTSVRGLECNLSGLENLAAKLYQETGDRALTSAFCFDFISDTIKKLTENLRVIYPDIPVIYAGGVMSNKRIAASLCSLGNVYFSEPEYSSDNAAGTALLCRAKFMKANK